MQSYFAGTFQPAFPLRTALRLQRPSSPDFVCGQLCKSDTNSGEGRAFFYSSTWNCETLKSPERFWYGTGCLPNPPGSIPAKQQHLSAARSARSEHPRLLGFLRAFHRGSWRIRATSLLSHSPLLGFSPLFSTSRFRAVRSRRVLANHTWS